MAKTIRANPDELKAKSGEIRKLKERHKDAMNHITNIVLTIGEVWRGDAQDAFVAKYQSMQSVYNSFEDALEEFAVLVDNFSNDLRSADQSGKSSISSIG